MLADLRRCPGGGDWRLAEFCKSARERECAAQCPGFDLDEIIAVLELRIIGDVCGGGHGCRENPAFEDVVPNFAFRFGHEKLLDRIFGSFEFLPTLRIFTPETFRRC